jgi:hypothetical protein
MRDQHRPKQDLIHEVVALRKQVTDLRDVMAFRGRVEDALRRAEDLTARVLFRGKSGAPHASWVIGARHPQQSAIALVVLQEISAASSGDRRSA